MKYLGINMTKYVQKLYAENCIIKEFKEDLNKYRNILCLWIRRFSIINMSVCPHLMYRFSAIPIKIPVSYFVDIDKLMLKFIWKGK